MHWPVGLSSRDSVGGRTDTQCSLEQQRQFLLNEHAHSAPHLTANTVGDRVPTTCHSAEPDTDLLTFNTNSYTTSKPTATATTTATSSNINSANNYSNFENFSTSTTATSKTSNFNTTTSNNNLFGIRTMCHSSFDGQSSVSPADLLINTLLGADGSALEYQAPTASQSMRHSSTSRSLPDLQFVADLFGAPMLSDVNSTEDFVEYQATSAPVSPIQLNSSAPSFTEMFAEPPAMPYFDVQGSAYDSFLNTPANFEYFSSPNVNISGPNQGVISDGQVLFAPLDEFAAKDAAAAAAASSWNGNDLLGDLVNGYPGLHFDLVHALVNSISPTMAYQPVGDSSSSSSTMSMLLNQAQSLADVQFNSADAGEALLVDTLLGMLSPTADVETTPMLYDATTASPAMLELFSSVLSPAPPPAAAPAAPAAVAPVCCAPANDEDDVPLLKRKYSEEEVSVPQVDKPIKKRQFYCDICNRGFDRQYNLTTHKRTHDPKSKAARPFKCTECTHTFTRKHDLTRHMVTHNPDADIKCPECSRPFARLDVLERHMLAIHKDKA